MNQLLRIHAIWNIFIMVWDGDKIESTTCYVDPAAIFEEAAIYAESQN